MARTLHSLSAAHQHCVSEEDYEVIAVDNGYAEPLPTSSRLHLGSMTESVLRFLQG